MSQVPVGFQGDSRVGDRENGEYTLSPCPQISPRKASRFHDPPVGWEAASCTVSSMDGGAGDPEALEAVGSRPAILSSKGQQAP